MSLLSDSMPPDASESPAAGASPLPAMAAAAPATAAAVPTMRPALSTPEALRAAGAASQDPLAPAPENPPPPPLKGSLELELPELPHRHLMLAQIVWLRDSFNP